MGKMIQSLRKHPPVLIAGYTERAEGNCTSSERWSQTVCLVYLENLAIICRSEVHRVCWTVPFLVSLGWPSTQHRLGQPL